jgi:hypothetical protein
MPEPEFLQLAHLAPTQGKTLFDFAGRIAALLQDQKVLSNEALTACVDDLLGSVYTLIFALHHDFDDRPNRLAPKDINAVLVRAQHISQGKVRNDGKWTAGFYFSNALFRIAAVYHRVLKVFTGRDDLTVGNLSPIAKTLCGNRNKTWADANLVLVHKEVNHLKHAEDGIIGGRKVSFREAESAVGEILDLIDCLK